MGMVWPNWRLCAIFDGVVSSRRSANGLGAQCSYAPPLQSRSAVNQSRVRECALFGADEVELHIRRASIID